MNKKFKKLKEAALYDQIRYLGTHGYTPREIRKAIRHLMPKYKLPSLKVIKMLTMSVSKLF